MLIRTRVGTPNDLFHPTVIPRDYKTAASAKKHLRGEMLKFEKFGSTYNSKLKETLTALRIELDDLNVERLAVGDVRSWTATDEHSGFALTFRLEMIEK